MLTISQILVISGLVFVLSELLIGIQAELDLVLIGSSLILGGFAGIITNNEIVAVVTASIFCVAYILFGRTFVKKQVAVITKHTNIDTLIGKTATVITSISPDRAGRVRIGSEEWRAVADEAIAENEKVLIESVEGVSVNVKKLP